VCPCLTEGEAFPLITALFFKDADGMIFFFPSLDIIISQGFSSGVEVGADQGVQV
jgi:hypothetical protein